MTDRDIAIVGAGPYGLGATALLRRAGLEASPFGDVMSFWERHMPVGMFLRSSGVDGCEIGEQRGPLSLSSFSSKTGIPVPNPLPIDTFVEYGKWFQSTAIPDLDPRFIQRIDRRNGGYELELADGESFTARRVVVAAGIDRFAAVPEVLAGLDPRLASHSSAHSDLVQFIGKEVAVIGAGQSALEFAALLADEGASVEVIVRGNETRFLRGKRLRELFGPLSWLVYPPEDVGPPGINQITARPNVLRRLPRKTQVAIGRRAIKPAGAEWLIPRMDGIKVALATEVVAARTVGDGRVCIELSDGTERIVDHVIAATGFRIDVLAYPFLGDTVRSQLKVESGYPVLSEGFESSIPGLHFVGAPAARSYGPLMRFVSGTWFASRSLVRALSHS